MPSHAQALGGRVVHALVHTLTGNVRWGLNHRETG